MVRLVKDIAIGAVLPIKYEHATRKDHVYFLEEGDIKNSNTISDNIDDFDDLDDAWDEDTGQETAEKSPIWYCRESTIPAGTKIIKGEQKDIELNGVQVASRETFSDDEEKKPHHVFHFLGNSEAAHSVGIIQDIGAQVACAKERGRDLIQHVYNPYGIYRSGIKDEAETPIASMQDIIDPYVTAIKAHIDAMGGKKEAYRVTLKGHSLGGCYGVMVAAKLHAAGYKVNFFADRAPAPLEAAAKYAMLYQKKLYLAAWLIRLGLKVTNYHMDVLAAWLRIDPMKKAVIATRDDNIVYPKASMAHATKAERKATLKILEDFYKATQALQDKNKNLGEYLEPPQPHRSTRTKKEKKAIQTIKKLYSEVHLWDALCLKQKDAPIAELPIDQIKSRYTRLKTPLEKADQFTGGHGAPLGDITYQIGNNWRNRKNGTDYLLDFIEKCERYTKENYDKKYKLMQEYKSKLNALNPLHTKYDAYKKQLETSFRTTWNSIFGEEKDTWRDVFLDSVHGAAKKSKTKARTFSGLTLLTSIAISTLLVLGGGGVIAASFFFAPFFGVFTPFVLGGGILMVFGGGMGITFFTAPELIKRSQSNIPPTPFKTELIPNIKGGTHGKLQQTFPPTEETGQEEKPSDNSFSGEPHSESEEESEDEQDPLLKKRDSVGTL